MKSHSSIHLLRYGTLPSKRKVRRLAFYLLSGWAILGCWHTSKLFLTHNHPHSLQSRNEHFVHDNGLHHGHIDPLPQDDEVAESAQDTTPFLDIPQTIITDTTTTDEDEPWNAGGPSYRFPSYSVWEDLDIKAETLPDLIHIPLEDAVSHETLEGWEDEWFGNASFDAEKWGLLREPRIDFVYTWVNGSDEAFVQTIRPYEQNSTLNDPGGEWIRTHSSNRYRSWDELRYSFRSLDKYASFANKIQLVVNAIDKTTDPAVGRLTKQRPLWLKEDEETEGLIQTLSQEEFFGQKERGALPNFNSLSIESQLYNTPSNTDRFFAMSDDMLLGRAHSPSDIYSPLFGPMLGFKSNGYNTRSPPTEADARRFGEKPFLIYSSWILNRRFGLRKRKGQVHFGHSMSRSIAREVNEAFPRPALRSVCQRFRGEYGFQLYTWYTAFHYTIERHREALLYSYIVLRSDGNKDGNLDWSERAAVMRDLEEGMEKEGDTGHRRRLFYHMDEHHREAGLEPPKVNIDTKWTSLDGPIAIEDVECHEFDVNECLAPGFSSAASDANHNSYMFNTAIIFDHLARREPSCGDCLLKLILNRCKAGLEPLLPLANKMPEQRTLILKAIKRYQYTVVEPDALFVMITDSEQVESVLVDRLLRGVQGGNREVGQLCLNDDVATTDVAELEELRNSLSKLLNGLLPDRSRFEK